MTVEPQDLGGRPIGKKIRRVPGIDGLRGIAVLSVVIYHFAKPILPGGYLGVDVFFVLSGFLITSLLLREYAATLRISLKDFWIRRLRRILPAATMVLLIVVPIARWFGGNLAVGIDKQFWGSLFFVNNWVQIANGNTYFGQDQVQIFAHYWSLAVEEQFYIIFPPLVVGLLWLIRYRGLKIRPVFGAVFVMLALLSAWRMVALFVPGEDPTRVYYGTDTHAFGLLIGATLATLLTSTNARAHDSWPMPTRNSRRSIGFFGLLAFIALMWLMVTMGDDLAVTYRGGLLGASLLTAVVLGTVVFEAGPISTLMRTLPLRWLGERSFSLYLWHWPVIQLLHHWFPEKSWQLLALFALSLSLPVSAWSYRHIETPIRRGGYVKAARRQAKTLVSPDLNPVRAWISTIAAVLVIPVAATAALATAPDKTDIEQFLNSAAAKKDAPAQAADTAPPKPVREMPKGEQISAIGDSVMLASSDGLRAKFPGIYVDGEVSRALVTGKGILQYMIDNGTLDRFVVLGFGTNSQVDDELMDEVMDVLGPDRVVVITDPYGDRPWIPYSREAILAAAKRYDNLYVAPWCQAAATDPLVLRDDGIHPTVEGASVYADTIYDAFLQWKKDDKKIPAQCGA
ncbi:acyltransferase family protein [Corynebacterium gerontici]|nr:acyltransferase family protein [Corynebacterium gerontici]